jgi:hypothetical protein
MIFLYKKHLYERTFSPKIVQSTFKKGIFTQDFKK